MDSLPFRKNFYRTTILCQVDQRTSNFQVKFWERPSKYYVVEFTAVFMCLLLSWSRPYSMKWSSNFDNSRPLYLSFSNMINRCSNIWFNKNLKCQQLKKKQFFHIFKDTLFRNGWLYWYECWRFLRDFCRLSKNFGFATFPEI